MDDDGNQKDMGISITIVRAEEWRLPFFYKCIVA